MKSYIVNSVNLQRKRPYLEKLDYMATHDEVSVVRIHAKGAIKATLSKSKVIKEPDAKTQSQ